MHVPNDTLPWPNGHPTFQSCVVGEEPINVIDMAKLDIVWNWNRKVMPVFLAPCTEIRE